MLKKLILIVFILYAVSSCVPHKKLVYLQGDSISNENIKELNDQEYRLRVDDIIHIDIKAQNDELVKVFSSASAEQKSNQISQGKYYFSGYSVDKQGFIVMPYLDRINVLGFTVNEVADKLKKELAKYFKDSSGIFITVKLAGVRYTIIGEVGSTGSKVMFQNSVNILEALANAGDIKLTGDKTHVEVLRIGIDGVEKFQVDLTQMEAFNSAIFYIQPNDIINVPALKQKSYGTGETGAKTLTTVISVLSLLTTTFLLIKSI